MDVEQRIEKARKFLRGSFDTQGTDQLEEVIEHDDGTWDITFSFRRSEEAVARTTSPLIGIDPQRSYRIVHLSSQGEPKSIRIREFGLAG